MSPTKSANPKFTVSVVAHNGLSFTQRCLESIFRHSRDAELILTDNASTDGTAALMDSAQQMFRDALVFHNSNNFGFQEPNRRALDVARGEFFVLLNNDTIVPEDWLIHLVAPFLNDSKVALTGPHSGRRKLKPDFVGVATKDDNFDYIQGSCLMGRTAQLREIGLFDPKLRFAYGEDSDLSLRLCELGFQLHTVDIKVPHIGGATTRTVPGLDRIILENHAHLKQKWARYLTTRSFK